MIGTMHRCHRAQRSLAFHPLSCFPALFEEFSLHRHLARSWSLTCLHGPCAGLHQRTELPLSRVEKIVKSGPAPRQRSHSLGSILIQEVSIWREKYPVSSPILQIT